MSYMHMEAFDTRELRGRNGPLSEASGRYLSSLSCTLRKQRFSPEPGAYRGRNHCFLLRALDF